MRKVTLEELRAITLAELQGLTPADLAELRIAAKNAVIDRMTALNISYATDANDNILWIGGTKEQPWFLMPHDARSIDSQFVGTKTANVVDVYRGFNGMMDSASPRYKEKMQVVEELKSKNFDTLYAYGATKYFCREFLNISGLYQPLFTIFDGQDLTKMEPSEVHALGRKAQKTMESTVFPNGLDHVSVLDDISLPTDLKDLLECVYYHYILEEFAIRSSGPEDGANASASGKYLSTLYISGFVSFIVHTVRCMMSCFNGEALTYHTEEADRSSEMQGVNPADYDFAILIMRMVPNQLAGGVAMTCVAAENDTRHATISVNYGCGESVVQNLAETTDTFIVSKRAAIDGKNGIVKKVLGEKDVKIVGVPGGTEKQDVPRSERDRFCITDGDANELTVIACLWDKFFDKPYSDHEFGISNNENHTKYHLQTRSETTIQVAAPKKITHVIPLTSINGRKSKTKPIVGGIKAGKSKVVHADVIVVLALPDSKGYSDEEYNAHLRDNCVPEWEATIKKASNKGKRKVLLVVEMTYPSMESFMKYCIAFITQRGNLDGHTSIFSREARKVAIVGMGDGYALLVEQCMNGTFEVATIDATGSEGVMYNELLPYDETTVYLKDLPKSPVPIYFNIGNADSARQEWAESTIEDANLGVGIGLGRAEDDMKKLGAHPLCFVHFDTLYDLAMEKGYSETAANELIAHVMHISRGYETPLEYAVDQLSNMIGSKASAFDKRKYIMRFSDFKSNEYKLLRGGDIFEPTKEENPMMGYRGAARYIGGNYAPAFKLLECEAVRRAYYDKGFTNVVPELPFVRSIAQAEKALAIMHEAGLLFVYDRSKVACMFELDANFTFPDEYFDLFEEISVGGNDTKQMGLGEDRDGSTSGTTAKEGLRYLYRKCEVLTSDAKAYTARTGKIVWLNFCGNQPTTFPEFGAKLVALGFNSVSVVADAGIDLLFAITNTKPNEDQMTRYRIFGDGTRTNHIELGQESMVA